MAGTLTDVNLTTGSSVSLYYEPSSTFTTGQLYRRRRRDGYTESTSVASGLNTLVGLNSDRYEFYVIEDGDTGPSNTVALTLQDPPEGTGYRRLQWIVDGESSWKDRKVSHLKTRHRERTDIRGHWLRFGVYSNTPGERVVIRNISLSVRMKGADYSASQP